MGKGAKIVLPGIIPEEPDVEKIRPQVENGQFRNIKHTPGEGELRDRFEGEQALALIAKRALVGVSKLRATRGLVITDKKPLPEGEYVLTPLSLLKNKDGTASLMVSDLCSEILFQSTFQVVATAGGSTVSIDPKLSTRSPARKMIIYNMTANAMFCTFDGEYDEDKNTTTGATAPSATVGAVILANSSREITFRMQCNPRIIAPSGAGNANVIIMR